MVDGRACYFSGLYYIDSVGEQRRYLALSTTYTGKAFYQIMSGYRMHLYVASLQIFDTKRKRWFINYNIFISINQK